MDAGSQNISPTLLRHTYVASCISLGRNLLVINVYISSIFPNSDIRVKLQFDSDLIPNMINSRDQLQHFPPALPAVNRCVPRHMVNHLAPMGSPGAHVGGTI